MNNELNASGKPMRKGAWYNHAGRNVRAVDSNGGLWNVRRRFRDAGKNVPASELIVLADWSIIPALNDEWDE